MKLSNLFYWNHKSPSDNNWHPIPGASPHTPTNSTTLPPWLKNLDPEAMAVDVAPFIAGAGALTHFRQINQLGWTVPASIFKNVKTLRAMHSVSLYGSLAVLVAQGLGVEYRYLIPRWSHERERRRDEEQVREHVIAGAWLGFAVWGVRVYGLRWGRGLCWSPTLEMVAAGGLGDLLFREYWKAHGG